MASAKPSAGTQRPISPHLQIYSPLINMMMSIVHRITGVALYFGTLLLAFYLVSAASGSAAYYHAKYILGTPIGLLILFGYTWALFHHMLGGIRHMIWDTGRGFDLATVDTLCWGSLIGSISLTILVWIAAFMF
ncbi:MAG TPA: succinate dehydrogenase, cytochrome b556 subunit [Hyphomicrobiaceae bacterium]|jgi:succinate dehydrogenase / fumarate reductase cytochrome b subunit|nr:succinate dehydrogenase, cytochrome b556 subunit [Hyphomicrobiaceae bacterium]